MQIYTKATLVTPGPLAVVKNRFLDSMDISNNNITLVVCYLTRFRLSVSTHGMLQTFAKPAFGYSRQISNVVRHFFQP